MEEVKEKLEMREGVKNQGKTINMPQFAEDISILSESEELLVALKKMEIFKF